MRLVRLHAAPALLVSLASTACAYDWTVGQGGAPATSTASTATGATTTGAASGSSSASGATCATLLADYDGALLTAKRCTMTDVTACQSSTTDGCGCKVFVAHAGSPEATDFEAKKSAAAAAGCSFGCTTCPTGPVLGSCIVDLQHGDTSCSP